MTLQGATPTAVPAARNASIDILRFVGALGIVLFHCGAPFASIGLAALPMFVILLVHFGADRPLAAQAHRLLVPWAVWSGIYAALKILQSLATGTPLSAEFEPWMLLTGTSLHLWFLPFCVLFLAVNRLVLAPASTPVLVAIALAASAGCLFLASRGGLPIPLMQWVMVIPAGFAGLLMQRLSPVALAPLLLAAGATGAWLLGWDGGTEQSAIAGIAVAGAATFALAPSRATQLLSDTALGVYLVHPAVLAVALYAVDYGTLALFAVVTLGSLAIVLLLRRVLPSIV